MAWDFETESAFQENRLKPAGNADLRALAAPYAFGEELVLFITAGGSHEFEEPLASCEVRSQCGNCGDCADDRADKSPSAETCGPRALGLSFTSRERECRDSFRADRVAGETLYALPRCRNLALTG